MKSHTDKEQSKKLAEILPIESADMGYLYNGTSFCDYPVSNQTIFKKIENIPCWSLAALLSVIPNYKLNSEHNHHACTAGTIFGNETVAWFDNPIDACYEMILKLHDLKMLRLEKAKAYDLAVKRIKNERIIIIDHMASLFPELVESNDEKIRKALINTLQEKIDLGVVSNGYSREDYISWLENHKEQKLSESEGDRVREHLIDCVKKAGHGSDLFDSVNTRDIILTWLEKQNPNTDNENKEYWKGYREGKQEIIDKYAELEKRYAQKYIEKTTSKFKVDDWVVNSSGQINQITKVYDDLDGYTLDNNSYFSGSWANEYHLWTINDAKPGDILAYDNGDICIFDGTVEEGIYPFAYCGLIKYEFKTCDRRLPFSHDNKVHPATKGQRELLFIKMKEAGYEWDAEKKELKTIEK